MKLIDKDKIPVFTSSPDELIIAINDADIVDAMTISYMLDKRHEYTQKYGDMYMAMILNLIKDWRRDNK